MYISLSKTLTKCCGTKIGFGMRITKRNIMWMPWVMLIVCMFQMMWGMIVISFWLMYLVFYVLWRCISAPFRCFRRKKRK